MKKKKHPEKSRFESICLRVSMVSIVGNTILSALKLLAGLFAHSGAMVSDAVHSASDVFSSIIVIIGVRFSAKDSDREHPYGHERFECVAAVVLAVILVVTAVFIGHSALETVTGGKAALPIPGVLALIAAAVSIAAKESMFRYTRFYAKKLDSGALMADAWHHRSDALSSVGALVGTLGARMGYPILDPLAELIICLFILKAAYDIFKDAMDKMVDHACDEALEREIKLCAEQQDGVLRVDLIHTRVFGSKIYVDIEIAADGRSTLAQSHAVAEQVHNAIESRFPKVKHIMVHVNPETP